MQEIKRYILTGAPGCGKTAIVRALETMGYPVVEEAATDVIASSHARGVDEPWRQASFIDDIVAMQVERRMAKPLGAPAAQFHDRSAVCTYALSVFLDFPISPALEAEMLRISEGGIFQKQVFFVENLGYVAPTAARRISFEDSLKFEAVHERTYQTFGYELIRIAPADVSERAEAIARHVLALARPGGRLGPAPTAW